MRGERRLALPALGYDWLHAEVVLASRARPPSPEEATAIALALAQLLAPSRPSGPAAGDVSWRFSGRWWQRTGPAGPEAPTGAAAQNGRT